MLRSRLWPTAASRGPFVFLVCLVLCAALAALLSFASALPRHLGFAGSLTVALAGLVLTTIASLTLLRRSFREHGTLSHVGTAVVAPLSVVGIVIPGIQLVAGGRVSILAQLGFYQNDPAARVSVDYLIFIAALAAFWIGEQAGDFLANRIPSPRRFVHYDARLTYTVLAVVGAVVLAALSHRSLAATVATRGNVQGQGALSTLSYAPSLAVAIAILNRHWGSRKLVLLSVIFVAGTLLEGATRTPLFLVAVALVLRGLETWASRGYPVRMVLASLLVGYSVLVLFVAVSAWRGSIASGDSVSLPHAIAAASLDPFGQLGTSGFDTLDGLSLATHVSPRVVDASVADPLKAVVELVPRQLYPGKPQFLSNIVSHDYLNFGSGAGIFLSGAGYGMIVFGGFAGMLAMFIVIGLATELIVRRQKGVTMTTFFVTYFALEFWFGGDAFNLFQVFTFVLLVVVAYGVGRVGLALFGRDTRYVPAPG